MYNYASNSYNATHGTNDEKTGFFDGIIQSFEKNFIRENRWELILQGIGVTLIITVSSALVGCVGAFGVCMLRRTGSKVAKTVCDVYVKLLQGTPMVVLLMILYFTEPVTLLNTMLVPAAPTSASLLPDTKRPFS